MSQDETFDFLKVRYANNLTEIWKHNTTREQTTQDLIKQYDNFLSQDKEKRTTFPFDLTMLLDEITKDIKQNGSDKYKSLVINELSPFKDQLQNEIMARGKTVQE